MKTVVQSMKPVLIVGTVLMALPVIGLAEKGGNPSKNSEAVTAACLVDEDSVHVYSCKGLSNVVLWCNGVYVKHDDIAEPVEEGEIVEEIYDAVFDCGTDAEGNPISGPVTMVAIKSGSQHNTDVQDAPSGSGLFLGDLLSCSDPAFVFPMPGGCDVAEEPEEPAE